MGQLKLKLKFSNIRYACIMKSQNLQIPPPRSLNYRTEQGEAMGSYSTEIVH